jgi:hypothetical protein
VSEVGRAERNHCDPDPEPTIDDPQTARPQARPSPFLSLVERQHTDYVSVGAQRPLAGEANYPFDGDLGPAVPGQGLQSNYY